MLSFTQWQEKSRSSLAAARILLEHDQPVEAASRAYYAVYQMVTGVLIRLKLDPRSEYGNWAHLETQKMYRIHICQKTDMGHKERAALTKLRPVFWALLIKRYQADYGLDKSLDMLLSRTLWRDANKLVRFLENSINRGAL